MLFLLALCTPLSAASFQGDAIAERGTDRGGDVQAVFERGVDAYRHGAFDEADLLWRSLLEVDLGPDTRARLFYDLGNAAWRRGEAHEAIGWYSSTLRLAPRHSDAWHNLEFARASVGLEPADRGDLGATAKRVVNSLRHDEARWLALLGLLPLALALVGEALAGGSRWRRVSFLAMLLSLTCVVPWVWRSTHTQTDPLLVVGTPKVTLRSEPRSNLGPIGALKPGDEVERIDALAGWVRVRTVDGTQGWVAEDAVFALPIE